MKDVSAKGRNALIRCWNKYDNKRVCFTLCHPEPGPELVSGSTISGSGFLV